MSGRLLPKALELIPVSKVCTPEGSLYGGEKPYQTSHVRGTISESKGVFSEKEKKELEIFHKQFNKIVDKLVEECKKLGIVDTNLFDNLNVFSTRFRDRNYYTDQSAAFYNRLKQAFENILLNLKKNTLLSDSDKKRIMKDMLSEIIHCGPGIYNHILTAEEQLSSVDTIEVWLAQCRKTLIKQFSHRYHRRKGAHEGNITHFENVFLKYAHDRGLHPYGGDALSALNEIHERLTRITEEDCHLLLEEFYKQYNPTFIMTELANLLRARVIDRINKKREKGKDYIEFKDHEGFGDFIVGLPVIEEDLHTVFDANELEEKKEERTLTKEVKEITEPPFIRYSGYELRLKPIHNLMRSMMHFLTKSGRQLFEIFKDEKYILVHESPILCSIVVTEKGEEKHVPFSKDTIVEMDHKILRDFKLPFYQKQFEYYIDRGIVDFENCILEEVDFSKLDLHKLKLRGVQLKDVTVTQSQFVFLLKQDHSHLTLHCLEEKETVDFRELKLDQLESASAQFKKVIVTPDQFIFLFQKNQSHLKWCCLEKDITNNLSKILKKPQDERNILLFVAAANNSPTLIQILLASAADAGSLTKKGETPIELAAKAGHWECVRAFASAKKDKDNRFHYNEALLLAATAGEIETAQALLNAGGSFEKISDDEANSLKSFLLKAIEEAKNQKSSTIIPHLLKAKGSNFFEVKESQFGSLIKESRFNILKALLSYRSGNNCSLNSSPESARRKENMGYIVAQLMKKDEEDTVVFEEIRNYCNKHIQTGFWRHSALRSQVLDALPTTVAKRKRKQKTSHLFISHQSFVRPIYKYHLSSKK